MNLRVVGLAVMAVMLTALLFQFQQEPVSDAPERVFDDLSAELDQVNRIVVQDLASGEMVTLEKGDAGWVVVPPGYPADTETVSRFLVSLGELEISEWKTVKPENHARLGLASEGEDAGILVRLEPTGQALIVGHDADMNGQFARLENEDQTFLTSVPLDVAANRMHWLDAVAINVEEGDVQSVQVSRLDGEALAATRDAESGDWAVNGLPAGRELRYPTILDSFGRMLVNLRFNDVMPFQEERFSEANLTEVTLRSGETIQLRTVDGDDGYWLRVSRDEPSPWQYKISEFTYNELNKGIDDLLKDE